ncbi:MAG TPA: phosphate signaling complex protein PhoU [Bacteroidia bacterium]|jgi:phosphate transport system protein|nr:phosphate signaling complex protein PhoU [Bacteroidia bacterium]
MEHLQAEMDALRNELLEMYKLVLSQVERAQTALIDNNLSVVKEIASNEKLVNAKELQIDSRCETILALFTPVAVDLRFILSALKININLERIGDIADNIARMVSHTKPGFDRTLLEKINAKEAFAVSLDMYKNLLQAFEKEDTLLARDILIKDEYIDNITDESVLIAEEYTKGNPDSITQAIPAISIMKMVERIGDHLKNIAEEIIFYAEARVLKHSSPKP